MDPLVIHRSEHCISRKLISDHALKVLYRLKACGYKAYLAGGSVRDMLLGHRPKDFDVVTDAHPEQVRRAFRNCRIIGRRFRLAHVIFGREVIEVATFRARAEAEPQAAGEPEPVERPEEEPVEALADPMPAGGVEPRESRGRRGRRGRGREREPEPGPDALLSREGMILRDNVFGTPEEDAVRRDFTINALFYDIRDFSVIDYVGGMADLDKGLLRSIGPARIRYVEDPVRMIRAVRFASTLGLTIEPDTYDAIGECREALTLASRARLYEELLKLLGCGQSAAVFAYLRRTRLFDVMFPDLSLWLDAAGEPAEARTGMAFHQLDEWRRHGRRPRPALMFALLFGAYHEARAEEVRRQEGGSAIGALMAATAEHLARVATRIQVPRAVSVEAQHIVGMQARFADTRRRNRARMLSRHSFDDALDCFEFRSTVTGCDRDLVEWWRQAAAEGGGRRGEREP